MSEDTRYYYHKLDKIQYAIHAVQRAGVIGVEAMLAKLDEEESRAHDDLVEAEQAEEELKP